MLRPPVPYLPEHGVLGKQRSRPRPDSDKTSRELGLRHRKQEPTFNGQRLALR
jgi:hypothetical protein